MLRSKYFSNLPLALSRCKYGKKMLIFFPIFLLFIACIFVQKIPRAAGFSGTVGAEAWDYVATSNSILGSIAVGNVDSDAYQEVVVGLYDSGGGGRIVCLQGNDQNPQWTKTIPQPVMSTPVIVDIDQDGTTEILFGNHNKQVWCLRGTDGYSEWNRSVSATIFEPVAVGNVDSDADLEVIAVAGTIAYCISHDGTATEWSFTAGGTLRMPAIADVDADGSKEILLCCDDSNLYCLYGNNGTSKWNYTAPTSYLSTMSLADADENGICEIYFGSADSIFYCIYGNNGSYKWSYDTGSAIDSQAAIGDVDRDGEYEALFGSDDKTFYCLDARSGSYEWSYFVSSSSAAFRGTPCLGDIDDDGVIEVLMGNFLWTFYCFNGETGQVEWSKNDISISIESSPVIADVDADGNCEILYNYDSVHVRCLVGKGSGITGSQVGSWTCGYGGPRRGSFLSIVTPTLSTPQYTPASGNQDDLFTFNVTYTHVDNVDPNYVRLYVNGSMFTMQKATSSDSNYVDGCIYTVNLYLPSGDDIITFQTRTWLQTVVNLTLGTITVGCTNTNPCVLSSSVLDPTYGRQDDDIFTFNVTYTDADNNAPEYMHITINGTQYDMYKCNPEETYFIDGCTYTFETPLNVSGDYQYYFNASDGANLASLGPFAGPTVYFLKNYAMHPGSFYEWIDASEGVRCALPFIYTYDLPFTFNFYNETFTQIFICEFGYVSFQNYIQQWPVGFPTVIYPYMIAPFWAYLDNNEPENVFVKYISGDPDSVVIEWQDIKENLGPIVGSFEIVLYENGEIKFNYDYLSTVSVGGGYTCGLNLGVDSRFYSRYTGLTAPMDNYSILFTHNPYLYAPDLSSGQAIPGSGDQLIPYNFSVVYSDADNNSAKQIRVVINGTAYEMYKANPTDNDVTDGCTYYFDTYLQPADYEYYFDCNDGVLTNQTLPAPILHVTKSNNNDPVLSAPYGSPTWGLNGSTTYTFSITYTDADNNAPESINVTIGADTYAMVARDPGDVNYMDGKVYDLSMMLPPGNHEYVFNATDGERNASSGPYRGIEVELFMDWDVVDLTGFRILALGYHDENNPITKYTKTVADLVARGCSIQLLHEYITADMLRTCDAIWIDESGVPLQSEELAVIVAWCNAGGRIIITGDDVLHDSNYSPYSGYSIINALGVTYEDFGTVSGLFSDIRDHTITANINGLDSDWASFNINISSNPALRPLVGYYGRYIAATMLFGAGKVLLVSDDSIVLQPNSNDNNVFIQNCFGWIGYEDNQDAPYFSAPSVSAMSGNEATCFNFTVTVIDADNTWPHQVRVSINNTWYDMIKTDVDDFNWIDGCRYHLPVFLKPGQYNYTFQCNDGVHANSTTTFTWIVVTHSNLQAPHVEDIQSTPYVVNMTCMVNFSAIYIDADNNFPSAINITINGMTYSMVQVDPSDTNAMDGVTFNLDIALPFGDHVYTVNCWDGSYSSASDPATLQDLSPYTFGTRYDIAINEFTWDGNHKFEFYNYGPDRIMTGWYMVYANYYANFTYTFPSGFVFKHGHIIVVEEMYKPDAGDYLYFRNFYRNTYDVRIVGLFNASGANIDWIQGQYYSRSLPADVRWSGEIAYVSGSYIGRTSDVDMDSPELVQRATSGTIGTLNPGQSGTRTLRVRLEAPQNGSVVEAGMVTLNWTSIEFVSFSATYTVEIAADSAFTSMLYTFPIIPETTRYSWTIQLVNLTTGTYYWRVWYVAGGFGSGASQTGALNIHRNLFDPALVEAAVTPVSGNQYTSFVFNVTYYEPDNNAPVSILVWINGTSHSMTKVNASDTNYRDGCVYRYICTLSVGSYSFFMNCSDGVDTNATQLITGLEVVFFNKYTPQLNYQSITPDRGIAGATVFRFQIHYQDADNDTPSYIVVEINGTQYPMSKTNPSVIDYTYWVQYYYETTLGAGSYSIMFNASDSVHVVAIAGYTDIHVAAPRNFTMIPGTPYQWIDASGGMVLPVPETTVYSFGPVGFPAAYYGFPYEEVAVYMDGYIRLGPATYSSDPANIAFPSSSFDHQYMVAPFWDDIRTSDAGGAGTIYLLLTADYFVVQWSNVQHNSGELIGSFQVVVYKSGDIQFNYDYLSSVAGGYTCGLNLGLDTRYFSSFSGLSAPLDDYSILFSYQSPRASQPEDMIVYEDTAGNAITWQLYTEKEVGMYYVTRNGTEVQPWTSWPGIGADINIPVGTILVGSWIYTIEYNDSTGEYGLPDTVLVQVNDLPSIHDLVGWNNTIFIANATSANVTCRITDIYGQQGTITVYMNGTLTATLPWQNDLTLQLPVDVNRGLGVFNYTISVWDGVGPGLAYGTIWLVIMEGPSSNHPADIVGIQNSTTTGITWRLVDKTSPGWYRILRSGMILVAWTTWMNDKDIVVPVNTNLGLGTWKYQIEFNNSAGVNGTPDEVVVVVNDIPVVVQVPHLDGVRQNSSVIATWIITDQLSGGTYTLLCDGIPVSGYIDVPWSSGVAINIQINTNSGTGTFNYTLVYQDDHGTPGAQSCVLIEILPTDETPLYLGIGGIIIVGIVGFVVSSRKKRRSRSGKILIK